MKNTTGWLRDIFDLAVAFILLFVVIDILFPDTTNVINNLGEIVGSFASEGVVGLIALLFFLWIYKR
ncbi:MAG: hypothetical protein V3U24_00550 [Candidatus Neomarinimicrobiota bacterium]